jgi:hypothetical protein
MYKIRIRAKSQLLITGKECNSVLYNQPVPGTKHKELVCDNVLPGQSCRTYHGAVVEQWLAWVVRRNSQCHLFYHEYYMESPVQKN